MTMTSIYLAEKVRLKKILTCNHDYKAEVWHNWTVLAAWENVVYRAT